MQPRQLWSLLLVIAVAITVCNGTRPGLAEQFQQFSQTMNLLERLKALQREEQGRQGTDAKTSANRKAAVGTRLHTFSRTSLDRLEAQLHSQAARAISQEEYDEDLPCSFFDEEGERLSCTAEVPNHEMVMNFLDSGMTVLELGARYGTTTCAIASQLQNSGRIVAVEPDESALKALKVNLVNHNCNATVVHGVIGTVARQIQRLGDITHALEPKEPGRPPAWWLEQHPEVKSQLPPGEPEPQPGPWAPALPFGELETRMGMNFDALVADCEGCVENFLNENPDALKKLQMIIIEADWGHFDGHHDGRCTETCVDYHKVMDKLLNNGFELVHIFREQEEGRASRDIPDCCPWIHHFAFGRKWKRGLPAEGTGLLQISASSASRKKSAPSPSGRPARGGDGQREA
eukprot:TRINITY_DN47457_c0_g1_i1.p1 TRINITY_DN47457_c0_g1~~TRINITY_DN47457_c0_g1_i1.p1  ORF type:complete len:404 (-),score=97.68 TRINITY_DN47457_c0_g1_i1:79-1290(-)